MTVTEALKILQRASQRQPGEEQPGFAAALACGFTPLHLQLFLRARLQERLPDRTVDVKTGVYGNLAVTLENVAREDPRNRGIHALACAIEWPDLDPRFSYREAGSWGLSAVTDMVSGARGSLDRVGAALGRIATGVRVAVSLPTLPLPPLFHTAGWQASQAELLIDEALAEFAAKLTERRGTVVVNARRLNEESAPGERLDLKSDLATGLPYTLAHADTLAATFSRLLVPAPAKKGIITDLDDTLWHGIVGEVGTDRVAWDIASHHQSHGLYQKLLASLAEAGILVAIASKNDRVVVQDALQRDDLLLRPDQIFPVEAHWEAKSWSVTRILDVWNISADAVIFVDDSPMELAEVASGHPGITCIRFPANDPKAIPGFLRTLRDLCGKERISADDGLRLSSIRRGAQFKREAASVATPDEFLRAANATVTFVCSADSNAGLNDARALELVNKTNQFNINGVRYTEADWRKKLEMPDALLLVVSYEDKFGPLGKIGVIQGYRDGGLLRIETWVMSCRAFARRIEYLCLRWLFDRTGVREIEIALKPTAKNKPVQEFLAGIGDRATEDGIRLTRAELEEKCPPLYHHIRLAGRAEADESLEVEMERMEKNG